MASAFGVKDGEQPPRYRPAEAQNAVFGLMGLDAGHQRIDQDRLFRFRFLRRDAVPCEVLDVRGIPIEGRIYIVNTIGLFVKGLLSRCECDSLRGASVGSTEAARPAERKPANAPA